MSSLALFEYVVQLIDTFVPAGYNIHDISHIIVGITIRDFHPGTFCNTHHQHILLQMQCLKCLTAVPGLLIHQKFHCLCLTVGNGMHCQRRTGLILHGPHILDNRITAQLFRTDYTVQRQITQDIRILNMAQLCYHLRDTAAGAI